MQARRGIRLVVAYDGTRYCGWQMQQPGTPTIQGALMRAVERIQGLPAHVYGASRTDAGVHALGQVAAFDTHKELPAYRWIPALNHFLPDDIAVQRAEACAAGTNPRFEATEKLYRYIFHVGPTPDPLMRDQAWHLGKLVPRRRGGLDAEAMHAAACILEGEHDFQAFRSADDPREDTVRTMTTVSIQQGFYDREDLWALHVRGTAFLKHMVRIVAGTLLDVGRGTLKPADVAALLNPGSNRQKAGMTAPAHGLTLVSIALARRS